MNLKAGIGMALAGGLLALGGCVEFSGDPRGKQISKDEVRVKFTLCDDLTEDCNPEPMRSARRGAEETKVLLAFRVPKGTKVPKDFQPKDLNVAFTQSGSYTAEMNEKAPLKGNEKWHGFISEDISGVSATEAKFKLIFGLPKDPGGSFKYRPAVGYVDGLPEDTVTCADVVQDSYDDGDTTFVCVDDPETPEELEQNLKIKLD